jgi:tetratricopeptide (TPR) repeat protein
MRYALVSVLIAVLWAGCAGCHRSAPSGPSGVNQPDASKEFGGEMINQGFESLDRLGEFDATEVHRQVVQRVFQMAARHDDDQLADPLPATCPEPEMLRETVNRLNQWAESQKPPADWKLDPLVRELPPPLAKVPIVRDLDKMQFSVYDAYSLLEAVWLRDLSQWAGGEQADELQQVRQLFDWVVRNIQLDEDDSDRVPQFPWETLLAGRGTAMERAWVYLLLLRQQGIDAAILAVPPAKAPDAPRDVAAQQGIPARTRIWCVAVLVQQDNAKGLYLFEPFLGLPIPGRNGIRLSSSPPGTDRRLVVGEGQGVRAAESSAKGAKAEGGGRKAEGEGGKTEGGLDIRPATLAEVVANRSLLDRLDFDRRHPYWVKTADLSRIVVLVEASPLYLAARSRLVESLLAGQERLVLTTDATAQAGRIAAAVKAGTPEMQPTARLWPFPYAVLQQRCQLRVKDVGRRLNALFPLLVANGTPLFKGRILHLKGRFEGQRGAIECYQAARPATQDVTDGEAKLAASHYEEEFAPAIRQMPPAEQPQARAASKQRAAEVAHWETLALLQGKHDASYWLGLIAAEQGNFPSAIDYFSKRTLEAAADSPWTPGIHYNLGRAYEALGQPERAVEEYLSVLRSPMRDGNLVRARWLKELASRPLQAQATRGKLLDSPFPGGEEPTP